LFSGFKFSILGISVITFLSLIPGDNLPDSPVQNVDIIVHVVMYSFIGIVMLNEFKTQYTGLKWRSKLGIVLALIVYGGVIEVIQDTFIPGRFGSISDFMANGIGAMSGLLVYKNKYKS
jgi:VanZ family protein